MKVLSLKLKDEIFEDTERMVKATKISRNAYINKAVECYNQINRRSYLKKKLAIESKAARATSMEVLKEWEDLDPHLIE